MQDGFISPMDEKMKKSVSLKATQNKCIKNNKFKAKDDILHRFGRVWGRNLRAEQMQPSSVNGSFRKTWKMHECEPGAGASKLKSGD
jgi:hypothetical protein